MTDDGTTTTSTEERLCEAVERAVVLGEPDSTGNAPLMVDKFNHGMWWCGSEEGRRFAQEALAAERARIACAARIAVRVMEERLAAEATGAPPSRPMTIRLEAAERSTWAECGDLFVKGAEGHGRVSFECHAFALRAFRDVLASHIRAAREQCAGAPHPDLLDAATCISESFVVSGNGSWRVQGFTVARERVERWWKALGTFGHAATPATEPPIDDQECERIYNRNPSQWDAWLASRRDSATPVRQLDAFVKSEPAAHAKASEPPAGVDRCALCGATDNLAPNPLDVSGHGFVCGRCPTPTTDAGPAHVDRELLGQRVRSVWVDWAREQPSPKQSWLAPWFCLTEPDREVDRRIGESLFRDGWRAAKRHSFFAWADRVGPPPTGALATSKALEPVRASVFDVLATMRRGCGDEHCHGKAEREALTEKLAAAVRDMAKALNEVETLRGIVVACATEAGASVSAQCSLEFLSHIPEEMRLVRAADRKEIEAAHVELDRWFAPRTFTGAGGEQKRKLAGRIAAMGDILNAPHDGKGSRP